MGFVKGSVLFIGKDVLNLSYLQVLKHVVLHVFFLEIIGVNAVISSQSVEDFETLTELSHSRGHERGVFEFAQLYFHSLLKSPFTEIKSNFWDVRLNGRWNNDLFLIFFVFFIRSDRY
jgi:hypothetical protein